MQVRQVYEINNSQLLINIPSSFNNKKKVIVTLEQTDEVFEKKLELLKLSKTDVLFKNDVDEVLNDFENIDFL